MRRPLPIPPAYLVRDPSVSVLRAALGLTLYLDDPMHWAREGAVASLRSFLAHAPAAGERWFTTSAMASWEPLTDATLARIEEALTLPWGRRAPRHLLHVRLADDTGAPTLGWQYREIDDGRPGAGVGWLQIVLPEAHPADDLLALAIELGQEHPFVAGVGGYLGVINPSESPTAFQLLRAWCRRYLGLDAQHPDTAARYAQRALPGTNWITMLGPTLRSALPPGADLAAPWSEPVAVIPLSRGALLRAGESPTLGDVNTLTAPAAYAEVAHRLATLLPASPPELPHWDADAKETAAWMRRFVEPEVWS
ncbi:MAG: DUF3396 domain-containing protein [Polyangiales bacterium]